MVQYGVRSSRLCVFWTSHASRSWWQSVILHGTFQISRSHLHMTSTIREGPGIEYLYTTNMVILIGGKFPDSVIKILQLQFSWFRLICLHTFVFVYFQRGENFSQGMPKKKLKIYHHTKIFTFSVCRWTLSPNVPLVCGWPDPEWLQFQGQVQFFINWKSQKTKGDRSLNPHQ